MQFNIMILKIKPGLSITHFIFFIQMFNHIETTDSCLISIISWNVLQQQQKKNCLEHIANLIKKQY